MLNTCYQMRRSFMYWGRQSDGLCFAQATTCTLHTSRNGGVRVEGAEKGGYRLWHHKQKQQTRYSVTHATLWRPVTSAPAPWSLRPPELLSWHHPASLCSCPTEECISRWWQWPTQASCSTTAAAEETVQQITDSKHINRQFLVFVNIHLPIWSCSCRMGISNIAAIIWTRGLNAAVKTGPRFLTHHDIPTRHKPEPTIP